MYFAGLLGCFLSNKRQNVLFDPTKIFCGKIYENIIFESINCLVIYTQKMPQLNQQLKVQIEDESFPENIVFKHFTFSSMIFAVGIA